MGVYQCFFFCDWQTSGRPEDGECLDRAFIHHRLLSRDQRGDFFLKNVFIIFSSSARGSVLAWGRVEAPPEKRRIKRRGRGECDLSRGRGRGGGRKRRMRMRREVGGSPRHRMTAGESPKGRGASVSAPPASTLPPTSPTSRLSVAHIYI